MDIKLIVVEHSNGVEALFEYDDEFTLVEHIKNLSDSGIQYKTYAVTFREVSREPYLVD